MRNPLKANISEPSYSACTRLKPQPFVLKNAVMAPERRAYAPTSTSPMEIRDEMQAKATEVVEMKMRMLSVVCVRTIPHNDAQKIK